MQVTNRVRVLNFINTLYYGLYEIAVIFTPILRLPLFHLQRTGCIYNIAGKGFAYREKDSPVFANTHGVVADVSNTAFCA